MVCRPPDRGDGRARYRVLRGRCSFRVPLGPSFPRVPCHYRAWMPWMAGSGTQDAPGKTVAADSRYHGDARPSIRIAREELGMGQVVLGLVFHNHQPIGNFGWVNEEHYEKAY